MDTEITPEEANFINGEPQFEYNKIFKCFRNAGNGLLFRLVNEEAKQWAFYNDTTDTTVKVTAHFPEGTDINIGTEAKGMRVTGENGETLLAVTVSVPPRETVLFLEGKINGFDMQFKTEAAPADDVAFENGKPNVKYTHKYKCFKNNGNGLLFRLVDEDNQKWYFYNDTADYRMTATVEFEDKNAVTPLGNTKEDGAPEASPEGVIMSLEIDPGETEAFCSGEPENYRLSFAAEPISNDRPVKPEYENSQPDDALVSPNANVFKCFKKNGNGLLFRLVDEEKKLWAFYNDTPVYLMRATVRFAPGESFKPSDDAQLFQDEDKPGATILIMDIPPLTTKVFLYGLPVNYEVSFAAESIDKQKPEKNPAYKLEGPDESVLEIDEVYKCFKNEKEPERDGVLFRLVDTKNGRWAFYNDTKDVEISVRILFEGGKQVPLGNTIHDNDPDMGLTLLLEVPPGATELFAEGDFGTFKSKFTGYRRVAQ